MRFRLRTIFILVAVIAALLWAGIRAYEVYQVPWNAYAMWNGAVLIIDHMRDHNGEWPEDWDDLDAALQKRGGTRFGQSIEEIEDRIVIDFNADPIELAETELKNDEPPFDVVRLRNGRNTYWEHREPNEMIRRYLTDPSEFMKSSGYIP